MTSDLRKPLIRRSQLSAAILGSVGLLWSETCLGSGYSPAGIEPLVGPTPGLSVIGAAPSYAGKASTAEEAYIAASKVSACVVHSERSLVETYLGTQRSSQESNKALRVLNRRISMCLGSSVRKYNSGISMSFSQSLLRGMLARAVIVSGTWPSVGPAAPVAPSYASSWMSKDMEGQVVEEMAACLTATQPTKVIAVVYASPLSVEEQSATAAITSLVPSCLVRGTTLKTNANGLRTTLAEALYHRLASNTPTTLVH